MNIIKKQTYKIHSCGWNMLYSIIFQQYAYTELLLSILVFKATLNTVARKSM